MPIRVVCPQGHKILAPSSRAGQRIRCPRCRSELQVPEVNAADPSPAPKPAAKEHVTKVKQPAKQTSTNKAEALAKKPRWKVPPGEVSSDAAEPPAAIGPTASTAHKVPAKKPTAPPTNAAEPQPVATPPVRTTPPPLPTLKQEKPAPRPAQAKEASPAKPAAKPIAKQKPPSAAPPAAKASLEKRPAAGSPRVRSESSPSPPPPTAAKSPAPSVKQAPPPAAAPKAASRTIAPPAVTPPPEEPHVTAEHAWVEHSEELVTAATLPRIGMRHRPQRIQNVLWLAGVLAGLALFGTIPVFFEWFDYLQSEGEQPLARWTWFVLCLSGVQVAHALYLVQLPDWSSVWTVAIATLAAAMLYSMLYAVTSFAGAESELLEWLEIHATQTGRAAGWCFVMLALTGIYAYFCGRAGASWRHSEQLRTSLGLNS